jgi:hypothetical protein
MATPRASQRAKTPSAKRAANDEPIKAVPRKKRRRGVAARARSLQEVVDVVSNAEEEVEDEDVAADEASEEEDEEEPKLERTDITFNSQFRVVDHKKKELALVERVFNSSEDALMEARVFLASHFDASFEEKRITATASVPTLPASRYFKSDVSTSSELFMLVDRLVKWAKDGHYDDLRLNLNIEVEKEVDQT